MAQDYLGLHRLRCSGRGGGLLTFAHHLLRRLIVAETDEGRVAQDPVRGRAIFFDPASRLVMVQTSARPQPIDPGTFESVLVWRAPVGQVRR